MIFFIFDALSGKIRDVKRNHRKNPKKLRLFILWITLIVIVTFIFYYYGLFDQDDSIPLKINENIDSNFGTPNISMSKNNLFRNTESKQLGENVNKNIYEVVPQENVKIIDNILKSVKDIPPPLMNYDEYNFE